ncbi:hypothetical protein [Phaeacidiphilus oryzae]|nr:hypothetical protein [Phaeacidiphilus oryzae]
MDTRPDGTQGRTDLEPFWPSRRSHHFDQICRRALGAPARG